MQTNQKSINNTKNYTQFETKPNQTKRKTKTNPLYSDDKKGLMIESVKEKRLKQKRHINSPLYLLRRYVIAFVLVSVLCFSSAAFTTRCINSFIYSNMFNLFMRDQSKVGSFIIFIFSCITQ